MVAPKRVKLVLESENVKPIVREVPGYHDPVVSRQRLNIHDLIQGEMNEGYAIGESRQSPDGNIILFNHVRSDGETVSFGDYGKEMRTSNWIRSSYLTIHKVQFAQRSTHSYLVKLANEKGYRVELVD
jgi:hypothetical protein